ncbi:carbohydrate-binding domain-containing protein [Beduini massiliensis]|uniref:carbohydrate-binding domain-containing protein n=1 Tax=Beduini massiliensis TaxID=1585974 RepID=UPI000693D7E5|nr:carbohydrate-binding domain-containing protein [Beduini massiliensis]
MKYIFRTSLFVFALIIFLSGCQKKDPATLVDESLSKGNMIIFNDVIGYSGNGITVNNQKVMITEGGSYFISGKSDHGQIVVDAKNQEVQLVLDGLELTCMDASPVYIINAQKVTVTLNESTVNTLTDNSIYTSGDESSATLFSKADLILNGTGKLIVNANYNDAILSKDILLIESGKYVINSVDDGIIGKDSLTIQSGTFEMITQGDAFKTTNETDTTLGNMLIQNGTYHIQTQGDGFQSVNQLLIQDGQFLINTTSTDLNSSTKGIKAVTLLEIENGGFNIDSVDDCLHSNGDMELKAGNFELNSKDDAVHSDGSLTIQGGTISIFSSYEGLEANEIIINGGDIAINSSDDGLNAAGGNDQSNSNGRYGGDIFNRSSNSKITINGGTILINADGDGIDANGSIYINGGTIYVNGPEDQANNALDYDQECVISGGTLLALGQTSMLQGASSNSTQVSFLIALSTRYKANTEVVIKDSHGQIVCSYTALKAFQSIVFSDGQLKQGETYTIELDGNNTTIALTSIVTTSGNTDEPRGMGQNRGGW